MALHIMPDPEDGHRHDATCPCSPVRSEGEAEHPRGRGQVYRGALFTHRPFTEAPTPAPDDQDAELPAGIARIMPGEDPETGPEAECGHVVVETTDGEWQHHEIPDDGAPHAPTSECGCGPQRDETTGHVVYVHADTEADQGDDEDEWGGGAQ
jgi:hypothetical protein